MFVSYTKHLWNNKRGFLLGLVFLSRVVNIYVMLGSVVGLPDILK